MKKIFTLLIAILFLPLLLNAKGTATIGGSNYTADTLAHYKVGPGTYYTYVHFYGPKDMRAFYLEIDATNPYISFESVLGRDSLITCEGITSMAARKSQAGSRYFAGTNADFFATSGDIGTPVHGCAVESQLAKVPISSGPQVSFTHDSECYISYVTFYGQVTYNGNNYGIHNVNGSRGTDQLVLYNRYIGHYTHTNAYGYEVPVSLADGETWGLNRSVKLKVSGEGSAAGNMAIAENGAVLSGHGAMADFLKTLQPGDELDLKLLLQMEDQSYPDINCMVGGDRKILENGEVLETDWAELHPRTSIGYSADRSKVYMLVVDGRQSGYSDGATTKQMADMLKFAGAANGMNLDGGGSSGMYIEQYGQVNSPSDGHERAVSNGIFVVSTAPDDNNIAEILPTLEYIILPKNGVFTPSFMGYNQYGYLIDTDLQGVTLRCDESLGYVKGTDTFVASGDGSGKLYASYNGVETSIDIVIGEPVGLTMRLDSIINDGLYEYPIEITSIVNNEPMIISPDVFDWTIEDPSICSITDGVLKGLANGKTMIYCQQDDFRDSLSVTVQIPPYHSQPVDDFSDAESWKVTSSALKDITIVPVAQGTEFHYTYSTGRAPYMQIAKDINLYSLPDTLRITLNTGETLVNKIALSMKDNASMTSRITEFEDIPQNADHTISIPMNGYFENYRDMALYPVRFQSLKLFVTGSSQTAGNQYVIALKEFSLIYDGITLNVSNPEIAEALRVYPNPVNAGDAQVRFVLSESADVAYELYDLGGKLLKKAEMGIMPAGEIALPTGELGSGTYLLTIRRGDKIDTVKLIIR